MWGEYSDPLQIKFKDEIFTEYNSKAKHDFQNSGILCEHVSTCSLSLSETETEPPLKGGSRTKDNDKSVLGPLPLYAVIIMGVGALGVLTLLIIVVVCCCYLSYHKKTMKNIVKVGGCRKNMGLIKVVVYFQLCIHSSLASIQTNRLSR